MRENQKRANDYSKMSTQRLAIDEKVLELITCWDRKQRKQDIKLVIKRDKDDKNNQLIEFASIKSSDYSSYVLEEAKKKSI